MSNAEPNPLPGQVKRNTQSTIFDSSSCRISIDCIPERRYAIKDNGRSRRFSYHQVVLGWIVAVGFLSQWPLLVQAQQTRPRVPVRQLAPGQHQVPISGNPQSMSQQPERAVGFLNVPMTTMGGMQFWTDYLYRGGWRIQQNSETGHFRLIDSSSVRHAWGNFRHCQNMLDEHQISGEVKRETGPVVILLHGLIRTSGSMEPMEAYLKKSGYQTINFRYASTRKRVEDHAIALKSVIQNLDPQVTDIYVVAHSLGNIVMRRYLADNQKITGQQGDSRLRRMVMLGPPNQGSKVAQLMKRSLLFHAIAGKSGSQLASTWDKLEPTLATPSIQFGIIAGGQDDETWSNFVLKGKDDYTVSVNETKLAGARDFLVRPLLHGTMMRQPEVLEATLNFFKHGYFVSEQQRKPLE